MTLLQKWDNIKRLIDEKTEAFINSLSGFPTTIYKVTPSGQLIEIPVVKIIHINYDQLPSYSSKKPTREDVRKIESIYYNLVLDEKFIRFRYDQYNSYSKEQIINDKMLFLNKNDAEKISNEINDRIKQEEYLLSNGHERCQRCRKIVPKELIISKTIIGRTRKDVYNSWKNRYESKAVVTEEPMRFCSNECADHEQWSREG